MYLCDTVSVSLCIQMYTPTVPNVHFRHIFLNSNNEENKTSDMAHDFGVWSRNIKKVKRRKLFIFSA